MAKENTSIRLKKIMNERGLRQVDILEKCKPFCEKYGIKLGRNDLSQYVSGKVEPKQDKLTILGNALNVSEAWLMGFDVPKETYALNDSIENYPENIRAAARDIMDLSPEDQKTAFDMIKYLSQKGKEAKNN